MSYPHVIPHPPTPYVIRARWRLTEATSSCPPDSWRPPPTGGCVHPGRGLGFAWTTSISPMTTVTPYPISHSSAMVRMDRKAFHPTKQNKQVGQPAPSTDGKSRCPAPSTDGYSKSRKFPGIDIPVIKKMCCLGPLVYFSPLCKCGILNQVFFTSYSLEVWQDRKNKSFSYLINSEGAAAKYISHSCHIDGCGVSVAYPEPEPAANLHGIDRAVALEVVKVRHDEAKHRTQCEKLARPAGRGFYSIP